MNDTQTTIALPSIASAYHEASTSDTPAIHCKAAGEGIEITFTTAGSTKDHLLKLIGDATQENNLIRVPLTYILSGHELEQPVSCTLNLHIEPDLADYPFTVLITVDTVQYKDLEARKSINTDTYEFTIES